MSSRHTAIDSKGLRWYCLRSQSKREHIAAAHLRMLEGVSVFAPRVRFKRETRQGMVWVTQAMFPGYLFAQFCLEQMQPQVRYAHGVAGFVRFGNQYPAIEERALLQLREYCGPAEIRVIGDQISQGDKIRVLDGVFEGLEAVVTQVLPAGERVKILMDFLGREIEAEVERKSVFLELGTRWGV